MNNSVCLCFKQCWLSQRGLRAVKNKPGAHLKENKMDHTGA